MLHYGNSILPLEPIVRLGAREFTVKWKKGRVYFSSVTDDLEAKLQSVLASREHEIAKREQDLCSCYFSMFASISKKGEDELDQQERRQFNCYIFEQHVRQLHELKKKNSIPIN